MAKTKATKSEKRVRMSTRRSANFTHHEKQVLLSLMQEYRHIVEDRHTDGVTVREKNTAWVDLTNKYNAESDVSTRSVKQLRQCWKNLKSRSRVDFLPGNEDSGSLTLLPPGSTPTSPKVESIGSRNTLTLVTVGGISNSANDTNDGSGSSPSNNTTSSIDNANTIILNNILTNNSNNIIHNSNRDGIRPTNGIASGDLSSHSGSPGLTNFNQALPTATSAANRQRPESKTSSSNKKRKKKAPTNRKVAVVSTTAVAVGDDDDDEREANESNRPRRKSRPTLVHLEYDENGVLEDGENVAEVERPRRKTRPSIMHLDYDVSTTVGDGDDDDEGAVVADEDVSDRLQVNVAYPHDTAMVVSQSGHSQETDDVYPSNTLAVVSVSGSADRIHFNSHASSPDSDDIHPHSHEVNLHPQPHTAYRISQNNTASPHHHHLQIQPSSFQPSSNHLHQDDHTAGSEHDIKVFDSIRGFGKVLQTQNALSTHLVSHDGHTVHSVNLGPSINYSDEVDIINVPSSHAGPHIVSAHGANGSHIPSIEPVLLETGSSSSSLVTVTMDFQKTEHSERMRNIRLERRLIGIEHKARMELIKLKSDYVKMKMEVLLHDRS